MMNCPHCNTALLLSERKNIEIDYCPKCRGVWLDKGELDKLIEASSSSSRSDYSYDDDDREEYRGKDGKKRYKRGSFLGELFDF